MPQFAPGSLHTATVKFANQASVPFIYDVSFCLGATQTEVARTSFSVPGGQSLNVVFSITMPSTVGSYPVYLKVSSGGRLIATFTSEALDLVELDLALSFTNPKLSPVSYWKAQVWSLESKQWVPCSLVGFQTLTTPIKFTNPGKHFLLLISEGVTIGGAITEYQFGYYDVTLPQLGKFIWNSQLETLDGTAAINLQGRQCLVTGVFTGFEWIGDFNWRGNFTIQTADGVPGIYFSTIATRGTFPMDSLQNVLIGTNRKIGGRLTLRKGAYYPEWYIDNLKYVEAFPPSAFVFSGTLAATQGTRYEMIPYDGLQNVLVEYLTVNYSISGVAPFRICLVVDFTVYYGATFNLAIDYLRGPGSGIKDYSPLASGAFLQPSSRLVTMFAHPDLTRTWCRETWQYENWQRVAQASTPPTYPEIG